MFSVTPQQEGQEKFEKSKKLVFKEKIGAKHFLFFLLINDNSKDKSTTLFLGFSIVVLRSRII